MRKNIAQRLQALLIDYLCIVLYLLILSLITIGVYYLFFSGIPEFTKVQSQWIAFLTTIFPITIFFMVKESRGSFASFGKQKKGLKVTYLGDALKGSIIRNTLKFLPWQLGHHAFITGVYDGFESSYFITLNGLAILLPLIYVAMVLIRKDNRHLPDLLARSFVIRDEVDSKHDSKPE